MSKNVTHWLSNIRNTFAYSTKLVSVLLQKFIICVTHCSKKVFSLYTLGKTYIFCFSYSYVVRYFYENIWHKFLSRLQMVKLKEFNSWIFLVWNSNSRIKCTLISMKTYSLSLILANAVFPLIILQLRVLALH